MKTTASNITDEKILSLIADPSTLERGYRLLMGKYQKQIYWQIRRMVINHADANDVLQNCFLKIFKGIARFQGKSKLSTWMYRIAMNETITFLNQQKKKSTTQYDDLDLDLENQLRADVYFNGNDAQIILQKAITTLPQKQRQVFNMRYFEEMPYSEISAILGTSIGGLKASFHHAVKKIEQYIKQEETMFS